MKHANNEIERRTIYVFYIIINYSQAASLWLIIKSAQLREHDKAVNIILPKTLGLWAYDAFATFGTLAMILVGFGYATLCFCRDSCLNFVSTRPVCVSIEHVLNTLLHTANRYFDSVHLYRGLFPLSTHLGL